LPEPQATSEQAALEQFLAKARILSKPQPTEKGRNDPWVVLLGDGQATHRAIFKYIDRPGPQALAASYKHEIAAYALTKLLGVDVVPPVVARKIDGTPGSLQIMIEGCISESERQKQYLAPPDAQAFADAMAEIRVFEHLTYCERIDLGDLLVHKDNWKLCRVDFSEAFAPKAQLLTEADVRRCSNRLYKSLRTVPDRTIEETLKPWLEAAEIDSLLKRKALILEKIEALVKEKGEAAILFDIVRK
jgi:hypothetical protein